MQPVLNAFSTPRKSSCTSIDPIRSVILVIASKTGKKKEYGPDPRRTGAREAKKRGSLTETRGHSPRSKCPGAILRAQQGTNMAGIGWGGT